MIDLNYCNQFHTVRVRKRYIRIYVVEMIFYGINLFVLLCVVSISQPFSVHENRFKKFYRADDFREEYYQNDGPAARRCGYEVIR